MPADRLSSAAASSVRGIPRWRGALVNVGLLVALSVYYLNYGAYVEEGVVEDRGPFALPLRIVAVLLIFCALLPIRRPAAPVLVLIALYIASATGLVIAAGRNGGFNDILFFNTVLQLPLLLAFSSSRWEIEQRDCWRFMCIVLATQAIGDAVVWYFDASLWLSSAFVGGTGNPSSFGLLCTLSLAFCLLHRNAGGGRVLLALVLAIAAVMSRSLFAVMAVAITSSWWLLQGWRRLLTAAIVSLGMVVVLTGAESDAEFGKEMLFIEHKVSAFGALLGLVEYDVQSSASVAGRVDMYTTTLQKLDESPTALLWGGLGSQGYWPIDSQIFTYLGSFGVVMLIVFLSMHFYWVWLAWRARRDNGWFSFVALMLFAGIFVTNRILDYFPVATAYFLLIADVQRRNSLADGAGPSATRKREGVEEVI